MFCLAVDRCPATESPTFSGRTRPNVDSSRPRRRRGKHQKHGEVEEVGQHEELPPPHGYSHARWMDAASVGDLGLCVQPAMESSERAVACGALWRERTGSLRIFASTSRGRARISRGRPPAGPLVLLHHAGRPLALAGSPLPPPVGRRQPLLRW